MRKQFNRGPLVMNMVWLLSVDDAWQAGLSMGDPGELNDREA
jgi:hypothetical protein